jgi:dCMP deaminase
MVAEHIAPDNEVAEEVLDKRPGWDEYFMEIAYQVSRRTTCLRRAVGAVIVKDKRILATGYNGVPVGIEHCLTRGCLRTQMGIPSGEKHELCRGLHGEQNAIIQAAKHGISIGGASIYITTQPCIICAKMLINAGIQEIIFDADYPDELTRGMLDESGVIVRRFSIRDQR